MRQWVRLCLVGCAAGVLGVWPSYGFAEMRIGLAAPLSGRLASQGLAMQSALTTAIAEVNAAGGVLGEPLALDVEDDGCARATAEGAAHALLARNPRVVIGHPCSSAASVAASVYGPARVLFFAVGARHPDVTLSQATSPILRLAGRDDRQGDAAAKWLIAQSRTGRVAIVHDRTGYARALADRAVAVLKEKGFEAVSVSGIVAGKHSYAETVARLAEARADALFFAGYPDEAGVVIAGLTAAGLDMPMLGADALATEDFALVVAKSGRRVEVLLPADPLPALAGDEASGARARGALEMWIRSVVALGTTDGPAISTAIRSSDSQFDTPALGPIRFDASGDLAADAFEPASARAGAWVLNRQGARP